MKKHGKIKKDKEDFQDDGRTISDMQNISDMSNLFGVNPGNQYKNKIKDDSGKKKDEETVILTYKERRAMTKAAWLLGLKTAVIGAAVLLSIFLVMHILTYFWI